RGGSQTRPYTALAGVALLLTLGRGHALATTFNVPCVDGVGDTAALIQAITAANNETANPGTDTIVLGPSCLHTLTTPISADRGPAGLPVITSNITIQGNGSTITRDSSAPAFRLVTITRLCQVINGFLVCGVPALFTLQDTTLSGGLATGASPAHKGGAVLNYGSLTLTNSTISGNSASSGGGGILHQGSQLTIENSTIAGNSAPNGGGIEQFGYPSSCTVTNSTISGNTAELGGGFLALSGQVLSFTNSTITNNTAILDPSTPGSSGSFGGIVAAGIDLALHRTIISGNLATNPGTSREIYLTASVELTADEFNIFGIDGDAGVNFPVQTTDSDMDGKVDIVPPAGVLIGDLLASLTDNGGPTQTYALVEGSLAVDGVLFGSCPATDQRGVMRPIDGDGDTVARCDIGAFEVEIVPPLCGDGVREGTEQCDDGNTIDGDGCSATCQTETAGPVCGNS
ncbi:MAG: choice-of-anchor Q domain-containing protein, partial [Candidatus Binatia bacterium]